MDPPLSFRRWSRRAGLACAALLTAWYLIFVWNSFDFPLWAHGPCYSANHLYYITRHQTLWERFRRRYPDGYGTARLFDRSGKLLYEGKTRMGDDVLGPRWFEKEVSMDEDNNGKLWESPLPVPPGDERMSRTCYPVQIEAPAGR